MTDLSAFPITRKWPAANPDVLQLYSFPTPNGVKVSIMLEEIGLPYEAHKVTLSDADVKSPEFLSLNPNNKIPAIVDPHGPDGKPIGLFESGAILIYLAEKSGKLMGSGPVERIKIIQWLMFQMGGLGPMAGQAHHFRQYAQEELPYAIARYTNECNRLYGVMNIRLKDREFLAGKYSIADMACIGWIKPYKRQGQDLDDFKHLKRWFDAVMARPAVIRALKVGEEVRRQPSDFRTDEEAQNILFGQTAR